MPVITRIIPQRRRANRQNVYLDGAFAFGCNITVIARFRLQVGQTLSEEQVRQIQLGEVKQEAFDKAMRMLQRRMHSSAQVRQKLTRLEYGPEIISVVIEDLSRMGYVDDEKFARSRAQSAAEHRKHGKRRARMELLRAGVTGEVADKALEEVYDPADSLAAARALASKKAPALKRLEPQVARRRLIGMLQRRGFEYEEIRKIVEEALAGE